ncbi:MAG: undecaprenyldiphospho-muramoylpentapeptide beta-N-acetylglucosaminyltransferase [Paludibacteraceae bacterium]|nr:undecaprenyldiphospho-muramoylpentapeptide beta-N-acetylglucosaminyltransferase [Paludibacteraceae bacterium]
MKYLISGGGTGGHIFPAVSIANALKALDKEADILFVGALGRMEMERVPEAGYPIEGLPVRGFDRQKPWKNISVVWDMLRSMVQVRKIIRRFRPDVAIGVGGYASGAAMKVAARMGIPVLLQEQNGFAGVTNKLLRNDAKKICVAYEGMERFFPKDKLLLTGNPVRQDLVNGDKERAIAFFNDTFGTQLTTDRKTLLIIGGSLGARTINESIIAALTELAKTDIQVIWQTGKVYYDNCMQAFNNIPELKEKMVCTAFLKNMPDCYALADLVISRAGASSISEICLLGKPSILVPSPNVAEDHQTHNAMALVKRNAAELVRDKDAMNTLMSDALHLIGNDTRLKTLAQNAAQMGMPDSAKLIAQEAMKLI